jgi:hypothetical protein
MYVTAALNLLEFFLMGIVNRCRMLGKRRVGQLVKVYSLFADA